MHVWEYYTSVQFVEVLSTEESVIRIMFNDNADGSWSFVGRDCLDVKDNEPTMNLYRIGANSGEISPDERGTILHQLGHALGLSHGQQSPAWSGNYDVSDECKAIPYSQEHDSNNTPVDADNYSQLDTMSIMHYPIPRAPTGSPDNDSLSDLDKAYIVIRYPRADHHADPDWTLQKALEKPGVPQTLREKILKMKLKRGIGPDAEDDEDYDAQEVRDLSFRWVRRTSEHKLKTSSDMVRSTSPIGALITDPEHLAISQPIS
ncbi:zincin [Artomyces pyxidatus]|uniref:Zincin n=1 Tax=Artomyces pyxidatus TaxID=48021 RepID=A0ACB8SHF6_9AGAM|nr:zincin [Artomyces pyxidatus]